MHMTDRSAERRLLKVSGRAHAAVQKRPSAIVQAYLAHEPRAASSSPGELLDPKVERRRFSRAGIASEALVRRVGGFSFEVALKDVSAGGCRVEMLEPCEVGDCTITRFPQLEPLGSRVCWTNGTTTGMQFSTSIHPAVFDMLLTRLLDGQPPA